MLHPLFIMLLCLLPSLSLSWLLIQIGFCFVICRSQFQRHVLSLYWHLMKMQIRLFLISDVLLRFSKVYIIAHQTLVTLVVLCFQSDARALRVVLSLTGVKEGLRGHIVVEMSDLDNEPLVKLVGGELIETVVAHDVIGRLMIQCALQPGLAQVTLGS